MRKKRGCLIGNLRGGVRRGNPHSRDISGRATAVLDGVFADCVRSVLLSGTLKRNDLLDTAEICPHPALRATFPRPPLSLRDISPTSWGRQGEGQT